MLSEPGISIPAGRAPNVAEHHRNGSLGTDTKWQKGCFCKEEVLIRATQAPNMA